MFFFFRDRDEKAAHSSITKWLKDLTGSSNQSYDIGPHILVDDLNEHRGGKFRVKSESFKKNKIPTSVSFRTSDVTSTDDIYENVESVSKRNRRKFESFKEIKSKSPALDENIYENIEDKRKFKRHSFSGTRRDRHRKPELQDSAVQPFDELLQQSRSGKKKKDRHKSTGESLVRKSKESDDYERDNYANHVSEYEVYANVSTTLRLKEITTVENDYEVIDAVHVPIEKSRKYLNEHPKHIRESDICDKSVDKARRDQSCKRYEKNSGGGSVKHLSRHSVLYHSQNRGSKSRRSRQAATLRRHSFNLIVPDIGADTGSSQIR